MAAPYHQPTSLEEVRTLWIGDLQYWTDENYLYGCFAHTGEVRVALLTSTVRCAPVRLLLLSRV
jgi:hypothetical protein